MKNPNLAILSYSLSRTDIAQLPKHIPLEIIHNNFTRNRLRPNLRRLSIDPQLACLSAYTLTAVLAGRQLMESGQFGTTAVVLDDQTWGSDGPTTSQLAQGVVSSDTTKNYVGLDNPQYRNNTFRQLKGLASHYKSSANSQAQQILGWGFHESRTMFLAKVIVFPLEYIRIEDVLDMGAVDTGYLPTVELAVANVDSFLDKESQINRTIRTAAGRAMVRVGSKILGPRLDDVFTRDGEVVNCHTFSANLAFYGDNLDALSYRSRASN